VRALLQDEIYKSLEYATGDAHGRMCFLTDYGANPALGAASGRYELLILPENVAIFLVCVS